MKNTRSTSSNLDFFATHPPPVPETVDDPEPEPGKAVCHVDSTIFARAISAAATIVDTISMRFDEQRGMHLACQDSTCAALRVNLARGELHSPIIPPAGVSIAINARDILKILKRPAFPPGNLVMLTADASTSKGKVELVRVRKERRMKTTFTLRASKDEASSLTEPIRLNDMDNTDPITTMIAHASIVKGIVSSAGEVGRARLYFTSNHELAIEQLDTGVEDITLLSIGARGGIIRIAGPLFDKEHPNIVSSRLFRLAVMSCGGFSKVITITASPGSGITISATFGARSSIEFSIPSRSETCGENEGPIDDEEQPNEIIPERIPLVRSGDELVTTVSTLLC